MTGMTENEHLLSRRAFLSGIAAAGFGACMADPLSQWVTRPAFGASEGSRKGGRPRVVILGMDGLDPKLLRRFMDQGLLPHFKDFIARGDMKPLRTIDPPQSPVAWSTFMTGMDPGGHGIYDFVTRDLGNYKVKSAMSGVSEPRFQVGFGSFKIPLLPGKLEQMRQGTTFWEVLEKAGYSTVIHQMPANYPPVRSGTALSGMGTPDARGSSGTFSYYVTREIPQLDKIREEAEVAVVKVENSQIKTRLVGPPNTAKDPNNPQDTWLDMTISLDPSEAVAKFEVGGNEFVLKQGEWSDWIAVEFELLPLLSGVSATCRFYLQEVRPDFRLYVSPLQIDPADPIAPISSPADYSKDLQKKLGYFYTQELPADTKAYRRGALDGREFWDQSQFVFGEQRRALEYYLERYEQGPDLLFFYFSSVDQGCHMFWRDFDSSHPTHEQDPFLSTALQKLYVEMDEVLGRTLQVMGPEDTLIIMSDHGFGPYTRSVNLNSWLVENDYVRLRYPNRRDGYRFFENCRWDRTKAFNVGLNGVYVNLKGREAQGLVEPGKDYERIVRALEEEMLALKDPETGRNAIESVIIPKRDYKGPMTTMGPDLIVGFAQDYRVSWKSPIGEFPEALFEPNLDPWSGDHCIASQVVPGVLITNRKICIEDPALYDLTVGVLNLFNQKPLPEMIGRNCLV